MRRFAAILGAAGMLGVTLLGSSLPVQAQPLHERALPQVQQTYPNESYAQFRHRHGYRPAPRYYRHHHGHGGSALAAGAVGLAAGALIGSAIAGSQAQAAPPPPPGTVDPQLAAYCARKYRSYDPATGTFLSTNGMRYVCTYP